MKKEFQQGLGGERGSEPNNEGVGKNYEAAKSNELVALSVFQLIEYLANNLELQKKIFSKALEKAEITNLMKQGAPAKTIEEIATAMGFRNLTDDELSEIGRTHIKEDDERVWKPTERCLFVKI